MTLIATEWQKRVMELPEEYSLALMGGKAGGKTTCATLLALRHVEQWKSDARVLLIRQSHKALTDLELALEELLHEAYGKGVKLNRQDHVFRLPNGARIELGQLDGPKDLNKYAGRQWSLLIIDEYALVRDRRWVEQLKGGLRSPNKAIPLRTILLANPGGNLHSYCHATFIVKNHPWIPFDVDGETFVHCPSTVLDNPNLDAKDYLQKLKNACGNDHDLYRAYVNGDWNIARGAYFGEILDHRVHQLREEWPYEVTREWRPFIAFDYGYSAPSCAFVCLRATGSHKPFPRNSLILIDELATHEPDDLNAGLRWPPGKLADALKELTKPYGFTPVGVGDDSFGLEQTLLQVFRDNGIYLEKPRKERIAGWAKMREMLFNAKERNGKSGMWISAKCKYFWATVPFLERDPSRIEDMITSGPDHAADAARYSVMHVHNYAKSGRTVGMY